MTPSPFSLVTMLLAQRIQFYYFLGELKRKKQASPLMVVAASSEDAFKTTSLRQVETEV